MNKSVKQCDVRSRKRNTSILLWNTPCVFSLIETSKLNYNDAMYNHTIHDIFHPLKRGRLTQTTHGPLTHMIPDLIEVHCRAREREGRRRKRRRYCNQFPIKKSMLSHRPLVIEWRSGLFLQGWLISISMSWQLHAWSFGFITWPKYTNKNRTSFHF